MSEFEAAFELVLKAHLRHVEARNQEQFARKRRHIVTAGIRASVAKECAVWTTTEELSTKSGIAIACAYRRLIHSGDLLQRRVRDQKRALGGWEYEWKIKDKVVSDVPHT